MTQTTTSVWAVNYGVLLQPHRLHAGWKPVPSVTVGDVPRTAYHV